MALMFVAALGTLVWRHPLADVAAKAAAPLGAAFTALALYTGALWGRPTWGTFWEWDGRMTSTLILLFIYLGIIALWRAFEDQLKAARIVAIVTLVGGVDIPIIKFSVDWWNTLHQPASIVTGTGPRMAGSDLPAADADGAGLHAAVPDAAFRLDAHRNPAAPGRFAEPAGRGAGARHDRPRPACRVHRLLPMPASRS